MTPAYKTCTACGFGVRADKRICMRCGRDMGERANGIPRPPVGKRGWDKSQVKLAKFWR